VDASSAPENTAGGAAEHDVLFNREEPTKTPQKSTLLLWQFFLVPLLIVLAVLGVFLLFGAFAGGEKSPEDLLQEVLTGSDNEKRQAAHQLAVEMNQAYREFAQGGDAPFYANAPFQTGLQRALGNAVADRLPEEHQVALMRFVGMAGGRGAADALGQVLYPRDPKMPPAERGVRLGAAEGLTLMALKHPAEAAPWLAQAAQDPTHPQVRSTGLNGLARLAWQARPSEEPSAVREALRAGLEDPLPGARLNAAVGLALRGEGGDAVVALLEASLSREGLEGLEIPKELHAPALRNAAKAAAVLGVQSLKASVERITQSSAEGDEGVRKQARAALEAWGQPLADRQGSEN